VLYSYANQIDALQLKLGYAVLAREASYVVCMLLALWKVPAVLLANLEAREDWRGRMIHKALYVLAPEKFVAAPVLAAMGLGGELRTTAAAVLLATLDCCGIAALAVGAVNGNLPLGLAVGYGATAASFVTLVGATIADKTS
jgi:hypothetical protein